jgi:5'-3' exonuclease
MNKLRTSLRTQKKKGTLVVLDLSYATKIAVAVHPDFTFQGTYTGGFYGFLKQVVSSVLTLEAETIVICKDTPPYARKKRYPEYKGDRKKDYDEEIIKKYNDTKALIEEFLFYTNIPVWSVEGAEADDLIAVLTAYYHTKFEKIVTKSTDGDLKQLLVYDNFYFHKERDKIKKLYGQEDFKEEYPNIDPSEWVKVESLVGTHNNVTGIDRVGIKTAIKILRDPQKFRDTMKEHKALYERNLGLITIPDPNIDYPEIPELFPTTFQERKIIKLMNRCGIEYQPMFIKAFQEV